MIPQDAKEPLFRGVHDRLKQAAEDRRRNPAPVERATVQQKLAHTGIKGGVRQEFGKQGAINIRERPKLLVQFLEALIRWRIQHLEQAAQPWRQVRAVLAGALFDQVLKLATLENAGVFGEQAEQQADQIKL